MKFAQFWVVCTMFGVPLLAILFGIVRYGVYRWRCRRQLRRDGWHRAKIRNGRLLFDPPVRLQHGERIEVDRTYVGSKLVSARYRKVLR